MRDAEVAEAAARYLKQPHDKPFLMVLSLLNPHDICQFGRGEPMTCGPIGDTPPAEACPPAPPNLAPPENESDSIATIRKGYHASRLFPVGDFTEDQWRQYQWGYHRLVEKADAELAKVLAALRQAGLEESTAIVFTSDHGECAGAHRFNQKTVFYQESACVPLIVSWKGKTRQGESGALVNTGVDLYATLCDLAGLAPPANLTGRSLKPIALGAAVPADWRDHLVVQNDMVQTGRVGDIQPRMQGRMVRSRRYKYCVFQYGEQREELFDLETDPLETRNVAGDPALRETVLQHRELLRQFAREHGDSLVGELLADSVGPRPFRKSAPADPRG